jgi:hypothetical protein
MARKTIAGDLPGVKVDENTFVVLSSRMGRKMVAMPKIDPDNEKEEQKYFVPEAWERGEVIRLADICDGSPKEKKNVQRLLAIGAIGRMDHEQAATAVKSLSYRRAAERHAEAERRGQVSSQSFDYSDDEDEEEGEGEAFE